MQISIYQTLLMESVGADLVSARQCKKRVFGLVFSEFATIFRREHTRCSPTINIVTHGQIRICYSTAAAEQAAEPAQEEWQADA